jgi:hypothetical protein
LRQHRKNLPTPCWVTLFCPSRTNRLILMHFSPMLDIPWSVMFSILYSSRVFSLRPQFLAIESRPLSSIACALVSIMVCKTRHLLVKVSRTWLLIWMLVPEHLLWIQSCQCYLWEKISSGECNPQLI